MSEVGGAGPQGRGDRVGHRRRPPTGANHTSHTPSTKLGTYSAAPRIAKRVPPTPVNATK